MRVGCLLVHGFTGAPFEMEPLAGPLRNAGCVVRNIRLPGHDTSFEDFRRTVFADWVAHAEAEYRALEQEVDAVVPIGLSMGGTIALHLAQVFRPLGVAALAAPVYVYRVVPWRMKDWRLPLVGLLRHVRPVWPSAPRSEAARAVAPWRGYEEATALPQLHSLIRGAADVRRGLHRVTAPLLIMQARGDATVHFSNALHIAAHVGSPDVTLKLFDIADRRAGHHVITTHAESRDRVCGAVRDFVCGLFS
jgi:carboxylesterase